MNTEELRKKICDIRKPQVLNMSYSDGEYDAVLAMIAQKEDTICLWEISKITDEEYEKRNKRYRGFKTNRAQIKKNMEMRQNPCIKGIKAEGQYIEVLSSMGSCLGEAWNVEEQLTFLYMLWQGVRLGKLEQVPFDRLRINVYELEANAQSIWKSKPNDISLELGKQSIPVLIEKKLRLKKGEYKKPRIVSLKGDAESTVYIYGISYYDPWKDAETGFEDKRYTEQFTPEQLAHLKQNFQKMLLQVCPKGCVLPLIEYECDKGYQLQFYTTEYLKRMPEAKNTASFLLMNKKTGQQSRRVCQLEAVLENYEGEFAVELLNCYKIIPEKWVRAEAL